LQLVLPKEVVSSLWGMTAGNIPAKSKAVSAGLAVGIAAPEGCSTSSGCMVDAVVLQGMVGLGVAAAAAAGRPCGMQGGEEQTSCALVLMWNDGGGGRAMTCFDQVVFLHPCNACHRLLRKCSRRVHALSSHDLPAGQYQEALQIQGAPLFHMNQDPESEERLTLVIKKSTIHISHIRPQHSLHNGIMSNVLLQADGKWPANHHSQGTVAMVGVACVLRVLQKYV
jgi:hypothetical protein